MTVDEINAMSPNVTAVFQSIGLMTAINLFDGMNKP